MQCVLKIDLAGTQTRMYSIGLQSTRSSTSERMSSHKQCDQDFVTQMLAEARSVLRIVVDDLQPKGRLTQMPVRIYPRILSAVMYLLKVSLYYFATYLRFLVPFILYMTLILA